MAVVAAAAAGVSVSIWEGKKWRLGSGLGVVQAEEAIEQRQLGRKGNGAKPAESRRMENCHGP